MKASTGSLLRIALTLGLGAGAVLLGGGEEVLRIDHTYRGPALRGDYAKVLAEKRPEIVLLGNSFTFRGVDPEAFEAGVGVPSIRMHHGGGASALYYVMLKNLLARADPPPRIVAILHRNVFLTEPKYRLFGSYKDQIDFYADPSEPELDRLAYFPGTSRLEFLLRRWSPLYARRAGLRKAFEDAFEEDLLGLATGRSPDELGAALAGVFTDARTDVEEEDDEDLGPLIGALSPNFDDFEARLPLSFLPDMVEIARQAGIQLVMVRLRTRKDARPWEELSDSVRAFQERLVPYHAAFDAYMAEHGIPVIDMTGAEEIRVEHFANGDHLNPRGQRIHTQLLIARFRALLEELDAR